MVDGVALWLAQYSTIPPHVNANTGHIPVSICTLRVAQSMITLLHWYSICVRPLRVLENAGASVCYTGNFIEWFGVSGNLNKT